MTSSTNAVGCPFVDTSLTPRADLAADAAIDRLRLRQSIDLSGWTGYEHLQTPAER
jgi:hypothetical protein